MPTPPGRSLHAPPTISVYAPSGLTPPEAAVIDDGVSTALCTGDLDQRTRIRQTERLVLVKEQNKSFLGPQEIDNTSSCVTFGNVGTLDSCLAANTGKYI